MAIQLFDCDDDGISDRSRDAIQSVFICIWSNDDVDDVVEWFGTNHSKSTG